MVPIAPAIRDLSKAVVALVTTGGIVPVDNPDRIQSASATRWGRYDVSGMERLSAGQFKTIHAGFDPAAANADPNVIVPLDAMRAYEREGKIGRLHNWFYSTVGTGTTEAEARRDDSLFAGRRGNRHYYGLHMRHLYALRCNDGKRV